MLKRALLALSLVAAPVLAGASCESIFSGPLVGSGFVDEAWYQSRIDEYLAAVAPASSTGDPMTAIAQLERSRRDPGYAMPPLAADAFASRFALMATLEDTSDFGALYLLNLLMGYRDDPALGAARVAQIENALFAYK